MIKKDTFFGYLPSTLNGSEYIFTTENSEIPSSYSYRSFLSKVLNQGELPICVPCSLSTYLNWRENLKDGTKKDNKIALMQIYSNRTNNGDGMTFKDALHFLRHHGVKSNNGILTIKTYSLVKSLEDLKYALVLNGPCVGALPVHSINDEFWKNSSDDNDYGYHAVSIVGYDENGFIIRNSWGYDFGDKGYVMLPYDDFSKLIELWTIIN